MKGEFEEWMKSEPVEKLADFLPHCSCQICIDAQYEAARRLRELVPLLENALDQNQMANNGIAVDSALEKAIELLKGAPR